MADSINPTDFVAWLVTQKNANGSLYLERVARAYANYLRTAPTKLDLSLSLAERDVFARRTTVALDELQALFIIAPNYKDVNSFGHQTFSSGMKAYRRYLESMEKEGDEKPLMVTVTAANAEQRNIVERRVDFDHTELCADCNPVVCSIDNEELYARTWRDLLILLIERYLVNRTDWIEDLASRSLGRGMARNFLLTEKPKYVARQISTGHWVYLNLSIPNIVDEIGKLLQYCGVNLENVDITYAPKTRRGNDDFECERNSSSSVYAQQSVRAEFKAWLNERYPDWSANTITMHSSDAYYLYNNDRDITLAEALNADDGEQRAYVAIERYFTDYPRQFMRASDSASGYVRSLRLLKNFLEERYSELLKGGTAAYGTSIPSTIIAALNTNYANGFRFDATTTRLLSEISGVDVDDKLQVALRRIMFRRNDDVYFLPNIICNEETQREIINLANSWLDDYGCFEISELYILFSESLNRRCIVELVEFEAFFEFLNKRDVRCVEYYRTRIARINMSVKSLSAEIAAQIVAIAHNEYGGTIDEETIRERFPAFSVELLASIIKEHAEELVKTEINGIICYQTLDALGLDDGFSDILTEVIEQLGELDLVPSEEVLHTAISIRIGVNFKSEYNIPDDKTYRRLIETYYTNTPKRKWLRGIFAEVTD